MIGLISYEFNSKKREWLKTILIIILSFASAFVIIRFFPIIIIKITNIINSNVATLRLFGLNEPVTSVTYQHLAFSAATFINPLIIFLVIKNTANSFWNDKRFGHTLFFLTQPVSKGKYWIIKILTAFAYTCITLLALYGAIMLISTTNIRNEALKAIVLQQVNNCMAAMILSTIFSFGIGALLGTAVNEYTGNQIINKTSVVMLVICLLPNLLISFVRYFENFNSNVKLLEKICPTLEAVRNISVFHWCSVWTSRLNKIDNTYLLLCIITAVICLCASYIFFLRKPIE